jgi:hypothetical protein
MIDFERPLWILVRGRADGHKRLRREVVDLVDILLGAFWTDTALDERNAILGRTR